VLNDITWMLSIEEFNVDDLIYELIFLCVIDMLTILSACFLNELNFKIHPGIEELLLEGVKGLSLGLICLKSMKISRWASAIMSREELAYLL